MMTMIQLYPAMTTHYHNRLQLTDYEGMKGAVTG